MREPFVFQWVVNQGAYAWVQTHEPNYPDDARAYLTDGHGQGERYPVTAYNPLVHEPGLFLTFADTASTRDGIAAFANRYGLLGGDLSKDLMPLESREATAEHSPTVGGSPIIVGERFADWSSEIGAMRECVTLWRMVKAGDTAGLSRHITWDDSPPRVILYDGRPGEDFGTKAAIAGERLHPSLFESIPRGNVALAAQHYLQDTVNRRLRERANVRLLWDSDKYGRLDLAIWPRGLIGALWVQVARAIDGDRDFRSCDVCGRWWEVGRDGKRTNRRYCSNACKLRAYRKRQKPKDSNTTTEGSNT